MLQKIIENFPQLSGSVGRRSAMMIVKKVVRLVNDGFAVRDDLDVLREDSNCLNYGAKFGLVTRLDARHETTRRISLMILFNEDSPATVGKPRVRGIGATPIGVDPKRDRRITPRGVVNGHGSFIMSKLANLLDIDNIPQS